MSACSWLIVYSLPNKVDWGFWHSPSNLIMTVGESYLYGPFAANIERLGAVNVTEC